MPPYRPSSRQFLVEKSHLIWISIALDSVGSGGAHIIPDHGTSEIDSSTDSVASRS
jgi:hypothetical protein